MATPEGVKPAEVREWVSTYTLNATPPGADQYNHLWDVRVESARQMNGVMMWAVRWMGRCLSLAGFWQYEPISSERTNTWLARHRFADLESALKRARAAAPEVSVNGVKAKDVAVRDG